MIFQIARSRLRLLIVMTVAISTVCLLPHSLKSCSADGSPIQPAPPSLTLDHSDDRETPCDPIAHCEVVEGCPEIECREIGGICHVGMLDHSLWEISTRCFTGDHCADPSIGTLLRTSRFSEGCWRLASESDLAFEMETLPARTIIFVHGNRTSAESARSHAINIFKRLTQRADEPIRLISLSWPSERSKTVMLPSHVVDEKKAQVQATGFQLMLFLKRNRSPEIDAVVGFSLGCAVVSCALHLGGGGKVFGCESCTEDCQSKEGCSICQQRLRIGFIAPAMDRCSLQSTGEYSRAMDSIERLVNLYNSKDPVLRRFRFFDRANSIAAGYAGYVGLMDTKFQPLAVGDKIEQFDCRTIGATHALMDYYRCSAFDHLLDNVLGK